MIDSTFPLEMESLFLCWRECSFESITREAHFSDSDVNAFASS